MSYSARLSALALPGELVMSITTGIGIALVVLALGIVLGLWLQTRARDTPSRRPSAGGRRSAIGQGADASIGIDFGGRVTHWDAEAESIFGWRRFEVLGKPMHELIIPVSLRAAHVAGLARLVAGAEPSVLDRRIEVPALRRDGTELVVELSIARSPPGSRDDPTEMFRASVRDITERRNAEQALRHMGQVQEEMGRLARVGGWELEPATGSIAWTGQMYEIFDLARTETPELDASLACFPGEARSVVEGCLQRAIDAGEGFDFTLPLRTVGGRDLWVRGLGKAERRADGSVRLYGALQDVTEIQIRNLDLIEALNAAEASSRSKNEFLANMSHEIRTPMTAILGYADLLAEEGDRSKAPQSRLELVDTIRSAGAHLLSVINDILDFSKIEAERMTIEKVETPVVRLLREVEGLVRPQASAKGLALTLQLGESVPERVLTDPTRLRQILVNLVGNAVKFTDRGTVSLRLRVEASAGVPRLVFEVDDTGRGLARAEAVRLFSLFTQADGTMTRRFGGTGLGLAISRRLARLMGGDVNLVRTAPDEGCCFQVDLPLEVDSDCRTMASLEVEEMERIRGPLPSTKIVNGRILLAEDNAINRRLVVLHLERAGAQVDTAANGAIALERIEKARAAGTPYDLLLTDMQMPELDGYALARILRDLGSNIPIIALTAHSMAEDRERCLAAGCDDYATKPIDAPSLLAQCARWMNREAIRKETDLDARAADSRMGRS